MKKVHHLDIRVSLPNPPARAKYIKGLGARLPLSGLVWGFLHINFADRAALRWRDVPGRFV